VRRAFVIGSAQSDGRDDDRSWTNPSQGSRSCCPPVIHPVWVRVTHWINALAVLIMIGSGWQIYDASRLFYYILLSAAGFARRMAGRRAAVAFRGDVDLMINGAVYLALGIATGRFRRKLFRSVPRSVA